MSESRAALCARSRSEGHEGSRRHLDLRVDFETFNGEEQIAAFGGRWDVRRKRFTGDGRTSRVFRLHPGQYEAARIFCDWLRSRLAKQVYRVGQRVMRAMLLAGGRRGGKTDLAIRCAIAYAIAFKRSKVWIVSPTHPANEEVDTALREFLPRRWFKRLGAPHHRYTLRNGSRITLRSASDPAALKVGRGDFVVLNEAQKMDHLAFAMVRPATSDRGGMVMLTANPPRDEIGQWVADFKEETEAGKRPAKYIHVDARKNPVVDQDSLDDMQHELSATDYRMERDGEFIRLGTALHAWSPTFNVRPLPDVYVDVTRQFSERHFGQPYDFIGGFDFQKHPYMAAVLFKAIRDPEALDGEPLLWAVDYAAVRGLEDAFLNELERRGYMRIVNGQLTKTVACIVDASAEWLNAERTKGRGSCDMMRMRGWSSLFKPDARANRNPEITERVAATNGRICDATGKRHVFSVPENVELNEALRKWEMRNGIPYRSSKFAHLADGFSYPIVRLYPRREPEGKMDIKLAETPPRSDWL